ncbi:MAG: C1 family peptidase [Spirochaetota bacterium]
MKLTWTLDLRSKFGPIRDQGERPTCLAFASSAVHEFARSSTTPFSPEFLYFHGRNNQNIPGLSLPEVQIALRTHGQPDESECPYFLTEPTSAWTPTVPKNTKRTNSDISTADAAMVESYLRNSNPVVIGVHLNSIFFDPRAPWIIKANGEREGLHALVVVGLASYGKKQLYAVRNSWGADWADSGYAYLTEDFLKQSLAGMLVIKEEV